MSALPNQDRIPTTIITGFLGSGKTTIILHLIDELLRIGSKPAYIKNEIGDADLDGSIVRGKHIKTKELVNGCICCTLVGPFQNAIDELIATSNPDRILIEASGAADPAAIALMVSAHPRLYRDGVVSIIDVENFEGYVDLSHTARNQTQFTDVIVFNKIESVSLDRKRQVVGYVRELNIHSPILEAPEGKIAAAVVFGLDSSQLSLLLSKSDEAKVDHTKNHSATHLEKDGIEALLIDASGMLVTDTTKQLLEKLPSSVFRIKGFLVDATGNLFSVQKVGARVTLTVMHLEPQPQLELVLIGFHISDREAELRKALTVTEPD